MWAQKFTLCYIRHQVNHKNRLKTHTDIQVVLDITFPNSSTGDKHFSFRLIYYIFYINFL